MDTDDLSVGANAVRLNGVSVRPVGSTMNAQLGLGSHAVSNSASHKVAGGTFTTPAVAGAALAGGPASGDTYGRGEEIEVRVTFSRSVEVPGTPQVALTVGAATRQADYAAGTGTKILTFRYRVASGDSGTDGIAVGGSALALNGGTIKDVRPGSTAATLALGTHAISTAANHKVNGGLGASAEPSGSDEVGGSCGVRFLSAAGSGGRRGSRRPGAREE